MKRGTPLLLRSGASKDDPSMSICIDFWAVNRSGDAVADRMLGERCADEALPYSRQKSEPKFLDCVIVWMNFCFCNEERRPGPLEQGFLDRIRRHKRKSLDRIAVLVFEQYPHLRH